MEDAELVKLVLAGSPDDFRLLVEKYQYLMEKWAFKHIGNFPDAENIAQEAFIEAYLSLDTLREPYKLGSWLQSIVSHIAISWIRKKRETISYEQISNSCGNGEIFMQSIQYEESRPDALLEQQEHDKLLQTAIANLPSTYQRVIMMFYFDDHSQKEIADAMNLTVPAVKSILHRSRQILRKELQKND